MALAVLRASSSRAAGLRGGLAAARAGVPSYSHSQQSSPLLRMRMRSAAAGGASASGLAGARGVGTDSRVVCITSGKGGVGKTTTAASIGMGLAMKGHKTCVIDFDIGLRNLDIHLGAERRVIFDFVHVLQGECTLSQALIKDKRNPNLYLLAASQTKDKTALTVEGVGKMLQEMRREFDFVLCDSPAGIESGAQHAMYFADDAVIVTNPELSSCRDSDKMIGFISSRSKRAELGQDPVRQSLLVTRYDPGRAEREECLRLDDIKELLGLELLGVIPESKSILTATNIGQPVICMQNEEAGQAYMDCVDRFLGEEKEFRFIHPKPAGLLDMLFSRGSN